MLARACTFAVSLGLLVGCSDPATLGGVCPAARGCVAPPAGSGGCSGSGCEVDAGRDGCAADGCEVDAGGDGCRDGSYELTRTGLALMLVVDDAASLAPWWLALHDGLLAFLQDPSSSGIAVGLQRFDEVCDAQHYATPIVPIAPLPENLPALEQAIPLLALLSTSTLPALDGALQYARSWAVANPDARPSVVLLTDATPGACDGLTGDIDGEARRIARAGYEGMPSIKTYVIGFSVLGTTTAIGLAGGTEPALISVTPLAGEVQAALDNVRRDAQPCAFRWPAELSLAPNSEVVIEAADGTERRYPVLASASDCADQDGFYVPDPTAAYPLVACARTCATTVASDRFALSRACK